METVFLAPRGLIFSSESGKPLAWIAETHYRAIVLRAQVPLQFFSREAGRAALTLLHESQAPLLRALQSVCTCMAPARKRTYFLFLHSAALGFPEDAFSKAFSLPLLWRNA